MELWLEIIQSPAWQIVCDLSWWATMIVITIFTGIFIDDIF